MKTYVTFGSDHFHQLDGQVFNQHTVAVIEGPDAATNRATAFGIFGQKFAFEYTEEVWERDNIGRFYRGDAYGKIHSNTKKLGK